MGTWGPDGPRAGAGGLSRPSPTAAARPLPQPAALAPLQLLPHFLCTPPAETSLCPFSLRRSRGEGEGAPGLGGGGRSGWGDLSAPTPPHPASRRPGGPRAALHFGAGKQRGPACPGPQGSARWRRGRHSSCAVGAARSPTRAPCPPQAILGAGSQGAAKWGAAPLLAHPRVTPPCPLPHSQGRSSAPIAWPVPTALLWPDTWPAPLSRPPQATRRLAPPSHPLEAHPSLTSSPQPPGSLLAV